VGFTLLYFSFGSMLVVSLYPEKSRKKSQPGIMLRGIAGMGVYSYTLYLWHVPLAQLFGSLAPRFGTVNQYLLHAVYFTACVIVGVVTSKLVEIPILKLRERLSPMPGAPAFEQRLVA
jgi:peptidoglycan/LPS O-acetylase OafA/YrhL